MVVHAFNPRQISAFEASLVYKQVHDSQSCHTEKPCHTQKRIFTADITGKMSHLPCFQLSRPELYCLILTTSIALILSEFRFNVYCNTNCFTFSLSKSFKAIFIFVCLYLVGISLSMVYYNNSDNKDRTCL